MTVTISAADRVAQPVERGTAGSVIPAMRQSPEPRSIRDLTSMPPLRPRMPAVPVTTLLQGARVAMHRTRRMTLLGEVPGVGLLVIPWLWPLHMFIVGWTAGHIRHTPDASLSFHDGRRPHRLRGSALISAAVLLIWLLTLLGVVLVLLGLGQTPVAYAVLAVAAAPAIIEFLGLVEFMVVNPEWVTIKRDRRRRNDGRHAIILTSLVARQDGHDFAGQLMDLEFPRWHAADALVIGYPGSKALISYYVRMGAKRERPTTAFPQPSRRRVAFDCRAPLRTRIR